MKLIRYSTQKTDTPRPGILTADGETILKTTSTNLSEALQAVSKGEADIHRGAEINREDVEVLPPLQSNNRLFCLGGVYTGHLEDAGLSMMVDPNQWVVPDNAIVGAYDPIILPESVEENVMPAAELCIVIGRSGKYIDPMNAFDYVAGYSISNDVTARTDWPGPMGYKIMDSFSPIGPYIRTADEVSNPGNLDIEMRLDDEVICEGSTSAMRFTVSFMLSYMSTITKLQPGDVISTGDPGGVAKPLEPGATVEIEIADVGKLVNPIVSE